VSDQVRRRVHNETLAHRGRKDDPLYRIRKLLLSGAERLDERGPHVAGTARRRPPWRDPGHVVGQGVSARRLPHPRCERNSRPSLGKTLKRWHKEILNHHRTGASNGPTEGLNPCVKRVKRCGHGFNSFRHYRLRAYSLNAGGVTWPQEPRPPRIRTTLPTQTRRATLVLFDTFLVRTPVSVGSRYTEIPKPRRLYHQGLSATFLAVAPSSPRLPKAGEWPVALCY
jgi:hypothetical protein